MQEVRERRRKKEEENKNMKVEELGMPHTNVEEVMFQRWKSHFEGSVILEELKVRKRF